MKFINRVRNWLAVEWDRVSGARAKRSLDEFERAGRRFKREMTDALRAVQPRRERVGNGQGC